MAWTNARHAFSSRKENLKLYSYCLFVYVNLQHISWWSANSPVLQACEHFVCRILWMCSALCSTISVQRKDLLIQGNTLTNGERLTAQVKLAANSYQMKAENTDIIMCNFSCWCLYTRFYNCSFTLKEKYTVRMCFEAFVAVYKIC